MFSNRLESTYQAFCSRIFKRMEKSRAWPEAEYFVDNAPNEMWGVVGESYTNWVYQQGFFAALIKCFAPDKPSLKMVDFGCGHGKLAPVSVFFTHPDGEYLGIDIQESYIDFCRKKYSHLPGVKFHLSRDFNALYSTSQLNSAGKYGTDWPLAPESIDILIAISVFTHLQEADAFGYINKIHSVLKPGALAIITCHIVEEPRRQPGFIFNYNPVLANFMSFATPLRGGCNWFTCHPELPESGIAINMAGLNSLTQGRFHIELITHGSATGGNDPLAQNVVVLRKLSTSTD